MGAEESVPYRNYTKNEVIGLSPDPKFTITYNPVPVKHNNKVIEDGWITPYILGHARMIVDQDVADYIIKNDLYPNSAIYVPSEEALILVRKQYDFLGNCVGGMIIAVVILFVSGYIVYMTNHYLRL